MALNACGSPAPPAPQMITDKGDPFSDLLVPRLQSSVTDGAVGVPVDSPVTVSAGDGVLGAVAMVSEEGDSVAGRLSPDGVALATAEPQGYNKQYIFTPEALPLCGVERKSCT